MEQDVLDLIEVAFKNCGEKFSGSFWARVIIIVLAYQDNFSVNFKNWIIKSFFGTVTISSENGQTINQQTRVFVTDRSDIAGKVIAMRDGNSVKFTWNHNGRH